MRPGSSWALAGMIAAGCHRAEPPPPSLVGFEQAAASVALPDADRADLVPATEVLPRLTLSRTEARYDNEAYRQALSDERRAALSHVDRVGLAPPFGPDPRSLAPLFEAMSHAHQDQGRAGRARSAIVVRADRATPPSVFEPALRNAERAELGELQMLLRAGEVEVVLPVRLAGRDLPPASAQDRCARIEIQLAPAGVYMSATLPGDPFTHELSGLGAACPAVPARAGRLDAAGVTARLRALVAEVPMCTAPRLAVAEGSTWGDLVAVLAALRDIPGAERVGFSASRPHPCHPAMSTADLRRHYDRAIGRAAPPPG